MIFGEWNVPQLWLQLFSSCSFCFPIDVGRWQEGFAGGSKPRNGQIFRHPYSSSYKSSILGHASLKDGLAAKARMFPLLGSCSIEAGNDAPALAFKIDGLIPCFDIHQSPNVFVDEWLSAGRPIQVQFLRRNWCSRDDRRPIQGLTCWGQSVIYPIVFMGLIHPKYRIAAINRNMT